LRLQSTFAAARLNLALLLFHIRRLQLALEAYRQVLSDEPKNASAWNGVGLVLVELKRFADARNAFARAVEADPRHAGAHYNLSFTLSNLGDFDGALRATKRALELDPYYVAQKFALTIDLQYEDANIGVVPQISADVTAESLGSDFSFDQRLLDNIFQELAPPEPAVAERPRDDQLALARDYVSKGLFDLAAAEAMRGIQRGADPIEATTLIADLYAKRGLHGEALERYREVRALAPDHIEARLGEVKALLALGRTPEAAEPAEQLLALAPGEVEPLVVVAQARAAQGDAAAALTALQDAQSRAPARADLHKLQGDVLSKVGDRGGALAAYRAALDLDQGFVAVWVDLGRQHELREEWTEAQRAYEHALDVLPTYHEATLALADLQRRQGRLRPAISRLADHLEQDPYDLEALILLGRTLLEDKRLTAALEAFRRVLKFDPDDVAALFHEGVVLARLRRYREAVHRWEQVTRLDPSGPYAQRARMHARTAVDLQHIFTSDAA
jgi:tetratricopeptide (TPR) repeat protein